MKSWRQSQILDLIDREAIASQEALRQGLKARGIDATQATISRDLKELGLVKRAGDGAYARPGAAVESPAVGEQVRRSVAALGDSHAARSRRASALRNHVTLSPWRPVTLSPHCDDVGSREISKAPGRGSSAGWRGRHTEPPGPDTEE